MDIEGGGGRAFSGGEDIIGTSLTRWMTCKLTRPMKGGGRSWCFLFMKRALASLVGGGGGHRPKLLNEMKIDIAMLGRGVGRGSSFHFPFQLFRFSLVCNLIGACSSVAS